MERNPQRAEPIKLNLDDLEVESFEAGLDLVSPNGGTVYAYWTRQPPEDNNTCDGHVTCVQYPTCDETSTQTCATDTMGWCGGNTTPQQTCPSIPGYVC
jgi:hypothetical protein